MGTKRNQLKKEQRWDVEDLYTSLESWEQDYAKLEGEHAKEWEKITDLQETLLQDLANSLQTILDTQERVERLYTYAHLRRDEDLQNSNHHEIYQKASTLLHSLHEATSWVEPKLLSLPQETLEGFLLQSSLEKYHIYLKRLLRKKPHTLDAKEEQLLAMAAKPLSGARLAFTALNNADLQFGLARDEEGQEQPITHANYGKYLHGSDRTLRKNCFLHYHQVFADHIHTTTELLTTQVEAYVYRARARNYSSSLASSLFPKEIPEEVYLNLLESVSEGLDAHQDFFRLRKTLCGLEENHPWDLYAPPKDLPTREWSFAEAVEVVVDSVAPLGDSYQKILEKGLREERWVDPYETANKRSGAYSSGCYGSKPYILMNYTNTLRDVFTLAHEAGHSMHSTLSNKAQDYLYCRYPIFLAEIASTFHEALLTHHLLQQATSSEERQAIALHALDDIRATLFRQTMFAEFELLLHKDVESRRPITAQSLNQRYRELCQKYFGESVTHAPLLDVEWSRIPHFYSPFYVYQYATGVSAALSLAKRVLEGGKPEVDAYLAFLQSGCSDAPLNTLQKAGVDLTTPTPITDAIASFREMTKDLAHSTKEC